MLAEDCIAWENVDVDDTINTPLAYYHQLLVRLRAQFQYKAYQLLQIRQRMHAFLQRELLAIGIPVAQIADNTLPQLEAILHETWRQERLLLWHQVVARMAE